MDKSINANKVFSILLSLLTGFFFLFTLVSAPLQSPLFSAGMSLALVACVSFAFRSFEGWRRLFAFPLLLPGFVLGYLGGTVLFLQPSHMRNYLLWKFQLTVKGKDLQQ